MNDLILLFKIIHGHIPINLPENFIFIKPVDVRYTRKTSSIIDSKDVTHLKCSIIPKCESFRNDFFYRTMNLWNQIPYNIRQAFSITIFKSQVIKLLWSADLDWPD